MLKVIHKYQTSIVSLIFILVVCAGMLLFGVDIFGDGQKQHAVKIDDTEISWAEFNRERDNMRESYRQRFGDLYYQLVKMGGLNLNQQLVDQMISRTLYGNFAAKLELASGKQEVQANIMETFAGNFSADSYRRLLMRMGMTVNEFEAKVADDLKVKQLLSVMEDIAVVSKKEAAAMLTQEKTDYTAAYAELKPEDFKNKVVVPNDEDLEIYFTNNATDYETQPNVKYSYVVFDPKDYVEEVEVFEDDIQFYYDDNKRKFQEEGQADLSRIELELPSKMMVEKTAEIRKKADEIREKALAGEDFAALAKKYSDDKETAAKGGDLGWVTAAGKHAALYEAALKLQTSGVTELVETEESIQIILVKEVKTDRIKEPEEVKEEIEEAIKLQEAPGYASIKAMDFLERLEKENLSLADLAEKEKLSVKSSEKLLEQTQDPTPELKGLTQEVLAAAEEKRQVVELKDLTILIEVTEYHGVEIPDFKTVQDKVKSDYISKEAVKLAATAADELLILTEEKELTKAAEESGYSIIKAEGLTTVSKPEYPFTNANLKKAVIKSEKINAALPQVYRVDGNYIIASLAAVKKPEQTVIDEELPAYMTQAKQKNSTLLAESLLSKLKIQAEIDVKIDLSQK